MKLKNKKRLLNELAREAKNPIEFIEYISALQQQSVNDLAKAANISAAHYYVLKNQIKNGEGLGISVCVKIANGLDIDPYILNRVIADYNMEKYLRNNNYGTHTDS